MPLSRPSVPGSERRRRKGVNYETIAGPLSRILCCLVPFAWLPVLLIAYVVRRGWRERRNNYPSVEVEPGDQKD
jgi:hypothetical protein